MLTVDRAIWLTPRLVVGGPLKVDHVTHATTAQEAVQAVRSSSIAALPADSLDVAKQAMALMGATPEQIERTVQFGVTGRFPSSTRSSSRPGSCNRLDDVDDVDDSSPA